METLKSPQGSFNLTRYPILKKQSLRAWDSADEYLLQHIAENNLPETSLSILIVNDSFGALSVALAVYKPQMLSDSYLSHQGTLHNLKSNGLSGKSVQLLDSLAEPTAKIDLVLIKIPRSLALLEEQLHRLRPAIHADTQFIGSAMVKTVHRSTLDLFEQIIGPTRTSLAKKKARLIFCDPNMDLNPPNNPYPITWQLDSSDAMLINHANVFSREKLDLGTRFFLQHIPAGDAAKKIIDLGCGNGIVGLIAAQLNPNAELSFFDESYMAVASAKANFNALFGDSRRAEFSTIDCLSGVPHDSFDCVLNNPPFHHNNAMSDAVAWQMFSEANEVLKPGGELWVIGNRHLPYHLKLKRIFGNVTVITNNKKFVIIKASKKYPAEKPASTAVASSP